jgi:hypothetical protein
MDTCPTRFEPAGLYTSAGKTGAVREFCPAVREGRNFVGGFWVVEALEGMNLRAG